MRELLESPLATVVLTLVAYRLGQWLRDRTGGHPLAQPVLVAIVLVGGLLLALDVDYATYAVGGDLIGFWLGPATVALALPLHRQAARLRGVRWSIAVAVPAGAAVSAASAYLLVGLAGGGELLALSMAPKAATTPVSIALAEEIGGLPALTAVVTVVAGVFGAVVGPGVLTLARVRDRRARGLALGAVSHGIGTSRALTEHETEGAFAGLSMGLTALGTSVLLPLILLLLT